nr:hypothetical protein [Tanacetum cinerariifolium]
MSAMANVTPIIATVKNASVKEKTLKETDAAPKASILDLCEEHYEDILPIIWDRARHDKRKEVQTTLDFVEIPMKVQRERENSLNSRAGNSPIRFHHERSRTRGRERNDNKNVFNRLSHRKKSVHERLSDTYSPSITKSEPSEASSRDPSHSRGRSLSRDHHQIRDRLRGIKESYDDTYSSHGTGTKCRDRTHDRNHSSSMKRRKESESPPPHGSKSSTNPFTPRIRNFKSSQKTQMSNNVKTYDGTRDREDHLKIFQAAAQVERWAMPTWCHMFNSTLTGVARVWFDELPPESIDGYKGLKAAFLAYFMQQKKTPKEISAPESGKFKPPPPMVTPVEKRSSNKFCEFHNDKRHSTDECVQLRKRIEELRVTRQEVTQSFARIKEIMFPPLTANKGTEGPLIIEAKIGGHAVHRIYVDRGSSMEVLYEHCFNWLWSEIKSQMVLTTTSLAGFSGETIWPLRQFRLLVTIGDAQHYTKAWMNFMRVRSPSPYNSIIGRPGIREIQAVPSTAHGMLKFPVDGGIVTIRCTILTPTECATIAATPKDSAKKAEARHENFKVAIHPDFSNQEITIRGTKSIGRSNPSAATPLSVSWTPTKAIIKYRWRNKMRKRRLSTPVMSRRNVSRIHDQSERDKTVPRQDGGRVAAPIHTDNQRAPKPKEELIMYLFASYGVISAVLMSERDTVQTPVYFVRRALQAPKLNYTPMVKLVMALIYAAKRLHRYLQILPDFLVEKPDDALPKASVIETPQEPWTMFTNGSSCVDGSGAGLILTSPEGTKFTYALRFQFTASNKEVEYEALIVGLGIATQIGRSFLKPWLRCVRPLQANYLIREIHEGSCSILPDTPSSAKISSITVDSHHSPVAILQIGIDIAGPFPKGPRKVKFLIVTMDYFTKEIISDNNKQFSGDPFKDWCEKLNIIQRFASVKHLQSNGLIERENRSLGKGIKARLGEGNKNWLEELPYVLWAHRTMIKSSNDDTLFSLTYGTEAIIHAEIEMPTYRTTVFLVDVVHNDEELRLNLDLLEERRERAAIREAKAKLKMTKYYNARVRGVTFRPGDFVYRSNDASHAVDGGKLDRKWEGPYEAKHPYNRLAA